MGCAASCRSSIRSTIPHVERPCQQQREGQEERRLTKNYTVAQSKTGNVIISTLVLGTCGIVLYQCAKIDRAAHGIAADWNQVSREAEQKHVSSKPEIPVSPEIKWEDLNAKFSIGSSLTELQKGELWKQYQGKKVRWQGPVREVSDAGLMEIIGTIPVPFWPPSLCPNHPIGNSQGRQIKQRRPRYLRRGFRFL